MREGDIVFQAGSDGSFSSPGHEALMISNNQIVEAAHTGTNISVRAYSDQEWQHAARPTGSLSASGGGATGNGGQTSANQNTGSSGNTGNQISSSGGGIGLATGSYGSSDELSNVQGGLLGGIGAGNPFAGFSAASSSSKTSSGPVSAGSIAINSSLFANGVELYKFLLGNLFNGNKIASSRCGCFYLGGVGVRPVRSGNWRTWPDWMDTSRQDK